MMTSARNATGSPIASALPATELADTLAPLAPDEEGTKKAKVQALAVAGSLLVPVSETSSLTWS